MDDFDLNCDSSDLEMLDDASEDAWYASSASPLQVDNGDTSSDNSHRIEPATSVVNRNQYQPRNSLNGLCSDDHRPASPHVDSTADLARTSKQDLSKNEVGNRSNVLAKIEGIFEAMVDVLLNERGQLSIAIKTRSLSRGQPRDPTNAAQTHAEPVQHLCFPGRTEKEAWRFAVVTRILELIHEALRNNVVLSKRDIYYRDPALFGRQSHVDRYVDNIAYTFGVTRSALHVIAAAKGLIAGAVSFCRRDGSTVDASSDREGLLMPNLKDILSVSISSVKWILVIEKEATFRSIAASAFWSTLSTNGTMVTAKGYPDISTRAMLCFLSSPSPQNGFCTPPVYAMVDFDPDGIAILSTYKYGSENLAHETSQMCLPQIQWLGLRSEHIFSGEATHADQGLLTLTVRDRKKARSMLRWKVLEGDDDMRRELQVMLMLNLKAELQLLDATSGGMSNLLESSLPV